VRIKFYMLIHFVILLIPIPAWSQTETLKFENQAWNLKCYATHMCEARSKVSTPSSTSLSLLFRRMPGQSSPVQGLVIFEGSNTDRLDFINNLSTPLFLYVNGQSFGALITGDHESVANLTSAQVNFLLRNVKQESSIEISINNILYQVSDKGIAASFLKMDEYQKRTGTVGAIVAKGSHQEQSVRKYKPLSNLFFENLSLHRDNIATDSCSGFFSFFDEVLTPEFSKKLKISCASKILNNKSIRIYSALIPRQFIENDPDLAIFDLHIYVYDSTTQTLISKQEFKSWLETDYGRIIEDFYIETGLPSSHFLSNTISLVLGFSAATGGYAHIYQSERSLFNVTNDRISILLENYPFFWYNALRGSSFSETWLTIFKWPYTNDLTTHLDMVEIYEHVKYNTNDYNIESGENIRILRSLKFNGTKLVRSNNEPQSPECKGC
jgi:hypothetical protein